MDTAQEIARLHEELRRVVKRQRVTWLAVLAVAVCVVLAAVGSAMTPDVVRARSFELVDTEGRVLAALLGNEVGGPSLVLRTEDGVMRAALLASSEGGLNGLRLFNPDGSPRLSLMSIDDHVGLTLYGPHGERRADFTTADDGGTDLGIRDGVDQPRFLVTRTSDGPVSLVMRGHEDNAAIWMHVGEDGGPLIQVIRGDGLVTDRLPAK